MKTATAPRKTEFERLQFLRWVLFLVTAARAAGMQRVDRQRLHALLFQSFASSLFYGIVPLRQRAQRTTHGPYYRAAHIALGRLILGGMIQLDAYDPLDHKDGLLFEGLLSPTATGLLVVAKLRMTRRGDQAYRFLLDLCTSMMLAVDDDHSGDGLSVLADADAAARERDAQAQITRVLSSDLSYRQATERNEVLLRTTINPDEEPLTVAALRDVQTAIADGRMHNRRDVLTAYQFLLRRRAA